MKDKKITVQFTVLTFCGVSDFWRHDYSLAGNGCRKYCDCSCFNRNGGAI